MYSGGSEDCNDSDEQLSTGVLILDMSSEHGENTLFTVQAHNKGRI